MGAAFEYKRKIVTTSKDLKALINGDPDEFLLSKKWKNWHLKSRSVDKVLARAFCVARDKTHIGCFHKERRVNEEYYFNCLDECRDDLKKKSVCIWPIWNFNKLCYLEGTKKLEKPYLKCIELSGRVKT